jgi:2-hydroxychromene-2-carboxylate isomerase
MAEPVVDFYYGLGSRYSYLASTQIAGLEAETGCRVVWRPLSSGDLMAERGHNPFHGEPVSGQYEWTYRRRDAEAWAAYYGVPYREPERFRVDPRHLAEACIAAGRLNHLVPYSRRLFAAIFVESRVIDGVVLEEIAAGIGLELPAFHALRADPATVAAHLDTVREAQRRGAFGVPTFFAGKQMFWGNDRLVLLRHHLMTRREP